MKLSKDQKRLIRSIALYTGIFIVVYPLVTSIAGKPWTWCDFFIFAGVSIVVFGIVAFLYVLGSHVPEKNGDKKTVFQCFRNIIRFEYVGITDGLKRRNNAA